MVLTRRDYFEGKSEKSARDIFFYYTGPQPSAVRYKNWKFYYTMVPDTATGGLHGRHAHSTGPRSGTSCATPSRSPSATPTRRRWVTAAHLPARVRLTSTTGTSCPSASCCGSRSSRSYVEFPPMQDPASYNLTQVLNQVKREQAHNRER